MTTRLAIAAALVAATAAVSHAAYSGTPGLWLGSEALPLTIAAWSGAEANPGSAEANELGADGTLTRVYRRAGAAPVDLYVAYYARQRPGISIHSPLHCLPGTGWDVQSASMRDLRDWGVDGSMRRLVARKEGARALVLYAYAVHGRLVGSEAASRLYLLADRLRYGRNDAALVRVVVQSDGDDGRAEAIGLSFMTDLLPHLTRLWR